MLAALAQETRLDVLRLLAARGIAGMAAGDIADALTVPSSTLSFHLSALEREGLLRSERQGRRILYAIRPASVRGLLGFLDDACGELRGPLTDPEEDHAMTPSFNVLFLCTANSARSIMAEAILASIGGGRFNAYSAGSEPAPRPQPAVIAKLAALGHDVSGLRSKSWEEFMRPEAPRMDFVIALCDMLEGQRCPDFGERAVTGAWPLPDPAKFTGGPVEQAALLNELYAALDRRLRIFIALPFAALDRLAVRRRLDEIGGMVSA